MHDLSTHCAVLFCLQDDKAHTKGQGLGFMFCCFSKQPATNEPERYGYEMEPTDSTTK
jgi:hypothetical protein